ncbi:MAG: RtcB family protein [Gallionellaceae bacterium]|jgi:tRNA-splicing ligase RtcB
MTAGAHSKHHRTVGHAFDNADPEFQAARRAGIRSRSDDPKKAQHMAEVGAANIMRYMAERPGHFKEAVASNGERGAPYLEKFNTAPRACSDCGIEAKNPAALRWHKAREHAYNHKVILAEPIIERADVFCLQVEEHHNFALAAGVFVHNCGMMAMRTTLTADDLPDNLHALRTAIEARIPHGRTNNGAHGDRGAWGNVSHRGSDELRSAMTRLFVICEKHPKLAQAAQRATTHAGTLGTGNHFVEICLDEDQRVWVMLHSGSRGIGNRIGSYFIELAKEDMRRWFINLPDEDLAYIPQGSKLFSDYCEAVEWAQGFARINRELMMSAALSALSETIPKDFTCDSEAVNCHHNYVSWERHFGDNVIVTRKGAVSAKAGELGIIPGSMGAKSFIVQGKGNRESFSSCSHGAGRSMSRNEARKRFTLEDHALATAGVECRKDEEVIDETPAAYKDIDAVMAAQSDLVDIIHTLKQVVCVKG